MQTNKKKRYLSIGGVKIGLFSDFPLQLLEGTEPFQCCEGTTDVSVDIIAVDTFHEAAGVPCGDDGIFRYYWDGTYYYKEAKLGKNGSISRTIYNPDFSCVKLYVNEGAFPDVVRTADKVLQLLPIKQLLTYYQSYLLHSSRITVGGKAILFTAPSQTGKTTQAQLWSRFEQAEIVGNDRTVLRKNNDKFDTYGYPVDGSSPVYNNNQIPLGAIVVLRQGTENHIRRLAASQALKFLMEQTVMDNWNVHERMSIQQLWLDLLSDYPVYLLTCRPDRNAVVCLKKVLEKDEVISIGCHS
ncbi:MAG: hypothetical protein ACI4CZ_05660 [Hominisplanchenecus sp.]